MVKQTIPQETSVRPRRSPLAGRNRLSVRNKEDGYIYRIVNSNLDSDPDRVNDLIERGYELVPLEKTGPIGDKRVDNSTSPGSGSEFSVGSGTKAVVMRIKKEWYEEDQALKQQQVDEQEQTMRRPQNADYGDLKIT